MQKLYSHFVDDFDGTRPSSTDQGDLIAIKFLFCASAASCQAEDLRKSEFPTVLMDSLLSRIPALPSLAATAVTSAARTIGAWTREGRFGRRESRMGRRWERSHWRMAKVRVRAKAFEARKLCYESFWRHTSLMARPTRSNEGAACLNCKCNIGSNCLEQTQLSYNLYTVGFW